MKYEEFLNTTKVLRMLYGLEVATIFFERNVVKFYDLNSDDLSDTLKTASITDNT